MRKIKYTDKGFETLRADANPLNTWYKGDGDDEEKDYPPDADDAGNEDLTDPEPDDMTDVPPEDLPRYRTLVKNKKLALKAEFGKRKLVLRKCGWGLLGPKRIQFLPNVKKPKVVVLGKTIYAGNENAYNAATDRFNNARNNWNACRAKPHGRTPGWRKKWKEFKRNGGLAQLKLQAKGTGTGGGTGTGTGGTGTGGGNPLNTWKPPGRQATQAERDAYAKAEKDSRDALENKGTDTEGMSSKMKQIIGWSIGAVLLVTGIIVVVKMRKK